MEGLEAIRSSGSSPQGACGAEGVRLKRVDVGSAPLQPSGLALQSSDFCHQKHSVFDNRVSTGTHLN